MGEGKRRRTAFKAQHPKCCFCGGDTATEERDHVPPRATFFGKVWPEGYEFPACSICNRRARFDDQYFAWHVRTFGWPVEWQDADAVNTDNLSIGVRNNQPLRRPVIPTADEEISWLAQAGMLGAPYRAVKLRPDATEALLSTYRKIAVAFFYKHVGRPLPKGALVGAKIKPNLVMESPETLIEIMQIASRPAVPKRGGSDFLGQFIYAWDYNPEQGLFAVSAKFGDALLGIAACAERPSELTLEEVFPLYSLDGALVRPMTES